MLKIRDVERTLFLSEIILNILKERGLTLTEIAKRMGVSHAYISQKYIIKRFGDYIHLYNIPKQLKNSLIDGIKAYYKDLLKINQKDITNIKSQITKLQSKKTKILNLYCDGGIDSNQYKEIIKQNEYELLELQNQLNNIFDLDSGIMDQIPKVFELLTNIDIMRSKANETQKGGIFQNIVFELFVDNKKQLYFQENELFYNIRKCNNTKWYSYSGNISNLYKYMLYNKCDTLYKSYVISQFFLKFYI